MLTLICFTLNSFFSQFILASCLLKHFVKYLAILEMSYLKWCTEGVGCMCESACEVCAYVCMMCRYMYILCGMFVCVTVCVSVWYVCVCEYVYGMCVIDVSMCVAVCVVCECVWYMCIHECMCARVGQHRKMGLWTVRTFII